MQFIYHPLETIFNVFSTEFFLKYLLWSSYFSFENQNIHSKFIKPYKHSLKEKRDLVNTWMRKPNVCMWKQEGLIIYHEF